MLMRATIVGVMVAASLQACGGEPLFYVTPVPSSSQLHYGEAAVFTEQREQVIDQPAGLRQVWDRIEESAAAAEPMPEIRFSQRMVILVAGGARRAGDRVRVDSVSVRDERFSVFYSLVEDCVDGAPTIYPLQIVEVARADFPASFVRTPVTKPGCQQDGPVE